MNVLKYLLKLNSICIVILMVVWMKLCIWQMGVFLQTYNSQVLTFWCYHVLYRISYWNVSAVIFCSIFWVSLVYNFLKCSVYLNFQHTADWGDENFVLQIKYTTYYCYCQYVPPSDLLLLEYFNTRLPWYFRSRNVWELHKVWFSNWRRSSGKNWSRTFLLLHV